MSNPLIPQYMKDMAEFFADEMAREHGFKRGDRDWKKAVHTFLIEAVEESMTPKMGNPQPKVKIDNMNELFFEILGSGGVFPKNRGIGKTSSKMDKMAANQDRAMFLSAAAMLTKLFMKMKFGSIPEDYVYKKGETLAVEKLRYYRIFTMTLIMNSLLPIFELSADDIKKLNKDVAGATDKAALSSAGKRTEYASAVYDIGYIVFQSTALKTALENASDTYAEARSSIPFEEVPTPGSPNYKEDLHKYRKKMATLIQKIANESRKQISTDQKMLTSGKALPESKGLPQKSSFNREALMAEIENLEKQLKHIEKTGKKDSLAAEMIRDRLEQLYKML